MKILQIVRTLDPSTGGVARAVISLSKALQRASHELVVASLDDPSAEFVKNVGLCSHGLGAGAGSYGYSSALKDWLEREGDRFDAVIVNGLWQHLTFLAWRRFARTPTPYYVYPHGMLDPWFKRQYPLKHLKKWAYWPWADYRVLRDAAAVIFTAEEEKLQARKSFWLYRCNERVAPLGVDTPPQNRTAAKETFYSQYPDLRGTRIVLFLGRLHPKKGCDLLIEAFPRDQLGDRPFALVLAGPDQIGWASTLRARAAQLKLSVPIVFTGMLEGDLKLGALEAADAFILPSHQENFAISVVEALAVGLPVLISDRVNIWREIDGDNAGYVETDDLAGTIRLLERWLRTPQDERLAMSQNAFRCFEQRFNIDQAAARLLDILEADRR